MKQIFLILAVVGLVSVDAPAAGMNLLELIGLGENEDSGARQESKSQRQNPIRVEKGNETITPTNAPTPVKEVKASPVADSPIVMTNFVERVETNVIDRVATNFVDRIVTNVIERVMTNDVAEVAATNNVELVAPKREPGPPRITSNKVYYDRKEGYAVFTGNVHVDTEEYQLHTKKAYVFFEGTNELRRIVASGGVAITNGLRHAYGTRASYYRNSGMVILYGDDKTIAEVIDGSKGEDQAVRGSKIKFWTMSEQIEVLDARISSPVSGGMNAIKNGLRPK